MLPNLCHGPPFVCDHGTVNRLQQYSCTCTGVFIPADDTEPSLHSSLSLPLSVRGEPAFKKHPSCSNPYLLGGPIIEVHSRIATCQERMPQEPARIPCACALRHQASGKTHTSLVTPTAAMNPAQAVERSATRVRFKASCCPRVVRRFQACQREV